MSFCCNCGKELREGARFCDVCGTAVQEQTTTSVGTNKRGTVYEGEIHKCPNCGEMLMSFSSHCPSCNYEIRNSKVADSVKEFSFRLSTEGNIHNRIELIRNYPIPNTKEEILEFMILASTNLKSLQKEDEQSIEFKNAWLTKFEQGYQKAKLVFGDRPEFNQIQEMYLKEQKRAGDLRNKKRIKIIAIIIAENIIAVLGIALLIYGVIVNQSGENSSMIELTAIGILELNAILLAVRKSTWVNLVVSVGSGFFAILLAGMLDNGSMYQLGGGSIIFFAMLASIKGFIEKK